MEPSTVNQIIGVVILLLVFSLFFSFSFQLKVHMPTAGCESQTTESDERLAAQSQEIERSVTEVQTIDGSPEEARAEAELQQLHAPSQSKLLVATGRHEQHDLELLSGRRALAVGGQQLREVGREVVVKRRS